MGQLPYRLDSQVVLITGASRGLGRHFAKTLSKAGAKVAACGRSEDLLQELVKEITGDGGSACSFPMDVTSSDDVIATDLCFRAVWRPNPRDSNHPLWPCCRGPCNDPRVP